MATEPPLGVALVGAGAFGEFLLAAFAKLDGVRIVAVLDEDTTRAEWLAAQYDAQVYGKLSPMLANRGVDIVALSTPPYLHAPQGLAILKARKHLFCEKPLALTAEDGAQLITVARENGVLLTVDYVMRANPYWAAAASLVSSGVLGRLRHIDLANHAAGRNLPDSHWFWKPELSGGIWIEHGVHFFDAFTWLTGVKGRALWAESYRRPDGAEERVEGLFRYGDVAVHCYHAFDKTGQTEKTTVRLTFDYGYVTLREWVPTSLELETWVHIKAWRPYLPGVVETEKLDGSKMRALAYAPEGKSALYRAGIQERMRDLVRAIRQPDYSLAITGEHGLASVVIANEARMIGER